MLDNLKSIEDQILEGYDTDLLIDKDVLRNGTEYEQFCSYVQTLYLSYFQNLIIADLLPLDENGGTYVGQAIDENGNSFICLTDSFYKLFYDNRSALQFDKVLSVLKQEAN